jgi:hypothetical protein
MVAWTSDELTRIGEADELELASRRRDGTLRNPVPMWVVRAGDNLYVRSVKGPTGAWFRGTQDRHEGRIQAGGVDKEVSFAEADRGIADEIDSEYRDKYGQYPSTYVDAVLTPQARAATIRLVPR